MLGEAQHHDEVAHLNERALKLYLRAKGYCLRAMEVRFPGIVQKLLADPVAALAKAEKKDVPLLYWMAASWGSAIALGVDTSGPRHRHADGARARGAGAGARRNLEQGRAARDVRLARQPARGARRQSRNRRASTFKRAVELQKGLSPGPYVALALGVAVPAQDRAEFEKLLKEALAIDPDEGSVEPARHARAAAARARAARSHRHEFTEVSASPTRPLNKEQVPTCPA